MRRQLDHDSLNEFYISGEYQSLCMGGIDDDTHFDLEKSVMSSVFTNIFDSLGVRLAGTSILEIGCGSGGILLALQQRGAIVAGFDLDPHKVEQALKRGLKNIQCQDALDERLIITNFDYVIISNVLEHLFDPKVFLHNLALKLSNSTSKLIIDVPNIDLLNSYGETTQDFFVISHLWYFSPITLRRMLLEAGFNVEYTFVRGAALSVVCSAGELNSNPKEAYVTTLYALNSSNSRYLA
jgi:SAM-dependent methyltransferase